MDSHEVYPSFIDMNQRISKYLRNFQQKRRAVTVFLYLRHQSFRSFDYFTQLKVSCETLRVINLANDFYSFVYCCGSSSVYAEIGIWNFQHRNFQHGTFSTECSAQERSAQGMISTRTFSTRNDQHSDFSAQEC